MEFVFPQELQSKCTCPHCDCYKKLISIPAHRSILAHGCRKFHEMFFDTNKPTESIIIITNWSSATFIEFLQLFYCIEPVFSNNHIGDVLQLITDYKVGHFIKVVENFMLKSVTVENCVEYLDLTLAHGLRMNLLGAVRQFIRLHANKMFKTEAFRDCTRHTLATILELHDLKCSETDVFCASMSWARVQCFKQGLEATDANCRTVLGHCFFLIRFPAMSTPEFSHCVARHPALLDADEILDILSYLILEVPLSKASSFSNLQRMID